MSLKTIIFFLSTCFAVLVSLQAIADDSSGLKDEAPILILEGQKETLKSADNTNEAQKPCGEESKENDLKQIAPKGGTAISDNSAGTNNHSFNFIYYILYKFKYIDSFGLSTPEKKRVPKSQENVVWL